MCQRREELETLIFWVAFKLFPRLTNRNKSPFTRESELLKRSKEDYIFTKYAQQGPTKTLGLGQFLIVSFSNASDQVT